jgi:hypothetical protein
MWEITVEMDSGGLPKLLSQARLAEYERRCPGDHVFWYRGLRAAVPGYRAHRRDPLYRELDRLRTLRNRIAHHRPIYHRHLEADHASVLRVLGYLGSDLEMMVAKHSRVPEVLARRP